MFVLDPEGVRRQVSEMQIRDLRDSQSITTLFKQVYTFVFCFNGNNDALDKATPN